MVTLLSIYLVTQYGKIFKRGTVPLKRVLFTLQHDLQEKEPKLQKATMNSMKVHVSSLHAPIYRNLALTSALLHRVPKIQLNWGGMKKMQYQPSVVEPARQLPHAFKDIVEHCGGAIKKLLNFDVCVVWWCSDGPINSQEYTSF